MSRLGSVAAWLAARSVRERWLLALMLAIAVPLLAVLLVYRPLTNRLEDARQRHVAAVQQHGQVLAQLEQLKAGAVTGRGQSTAPLAIRVTDSAARAGIRLSSNEPRGTDRVVISVAPSPPTTGLRWLRELEASGVRIQDLSIDLQGPGLVTINAVLAQGAPS